MRIGFSMEAETVNSTDISVVVVGGNVATNSDFRFSGITDGSHLGLLEVSGIFKPEWENEVVIQAKRITHDLEAYNFKVKQQGQVYNTFDVDAVTGVVGFLRAGTGSAGSADGFMFVTDTNTGTTFKIQLFT